MSLRAALLLVLLPIAVIAQAPAPRPAPGPGTVTAPPAPAPRSTAAPDAAPAGKGIIRGVVNAADTGRPIQFGGVELRMNARLLEQTRTSALRFGFTPPEAPNISEAKAVAALGLRLERRRAPIDVIVVDSIDRTPAEN